MDNINILITFLSGIGLGSVITIVIKHSLEQKAKFKEVWLMDYKQTCDGLLDSYREVALTNSDEALKKFAFYELKLKLYANQKVIDAIKEFKNSTPQSPLREKLESKMLQAMRNDLGLV